VLEAGAALCGRPRSAGQLDETAAPYRLGRSSWLSSPSTAAQSMSNLANNEACIKR
jgi:hypothetical protein